MKKVVLGFSYDSLAQSFAQGINAPFHAFSYGFFADSELWIASQKSVLKGAQLYLFFTLDRTVDTNKQLFFLMMLLAVIKRQGADSINLVLPYLPYARQDKEAAGECQPLAHDFVALLASNGVSCLVTYDIHAPVIIQQAPIPLISLEVAHLWTSVLLNVQENLCVVAPDQGGTARAGALAKALGVELVSMIKHRESADTVAQSVLTASIEGKHVLMVDDIVSTGGTAISAACELKAKGAASISALFTHGILSGNALDKLCSSDISRIFLADTLHFGTTIFPKKISVMNMHGHVNQLIEAFSNYELSQ